MSDGGKGSSPRPFSVSQEEFDRRWDNIFSKRKKELIAHTDVLEVNKQGQIEQYREQYWQPIQDESK